MTTAKIIDTTSRTEIKGRVTFVSHWIADATRIPATLTDADAATLSGGKSRAALVEAIREAERTNAERIVSGRRRLARARHGRGGGERRGRSRAGYPGLRCRVACNRQPKTQGIREK